MLKSKTMGFYELLKFGQYSFVFPKKVMELKDIFIQIVHPLSNPNIFPIDSIHFSSSKSINWVHSILFFKRFLTCNCWKSIPVHLGWFLVFLESFLSGSL